LKTAESGEAVWARSEVADKRVKRRAVRKRRKGRTRRVEARVREADGVGKPPRTNEGKEAEARARRRKAGQN